jgi:O-antigen ligase
VDNIALAQRFKVLLLSAIGVLFAIVLGFNIGNENYWQLLLIFAVIVVASIGLFLGDSFWVLTIASSFLSGTFPILRGQFTPFQILMALGVVRFVVGDVILKRKRLNWGNRFDLAILAGFMGVLLIHGVHDRFGMRFLGSSVWGGRNYVNVFVGLAAFFIVRSLSLKPQIWAKLPYAIFAVTGFDALIAIITTIFPSSIFKIYPFYSAVSLAGLQEVLSLNNQILELTTRLGAIGVLGFVVIIFLLASGSLSRLLSFSNPIRLISAMTAGSAVLFSSYRTSVIQTLLAVVIAGIRDLGWRVLAFLPLLAGLLFAVSIVNSEVVTLPRQVQRSLQFMPGKWDTQMQLDAEASNQYRKQIWNVFVKEYFPAHPLFGRGFGFRSEMAQQQVYNNPTWDRDMVEVGNIHNGFLATLDALGIIGTLFFVVWQLRLFARTFHVPTRGLNPTDITLRFLALYLAILILFYWIGAYTIGNFLPQEFALAAVLLRLQEGIHVEDATSHGETGTRAQPMQQLSPV